MKRPFFLFLLLFCLCNGSLLRGGTFEEHPFFRVITGKWTGEGELVTADGTPIVIKEVWEGKENEDGTFSITGNRDWGDDKQEFEWVFSHNPSTDLYECEYSHTGMDETIRLEVSITDTRAELTAPMGEPGSELRITNSIVEETIEGEVLVTNRDGGVTLKGKIIHTRVK